MDARKRIAVLFPSFLGGGAEAVGVWILDALKDHYDVTLVTLTDNLFEKYDELFGTRLAQAGIHVRCPFKGFLRPLPEKFFLRVTEVPVLRQHLLLRYFHSLRDSFDLCFSAYNEMDLRDQGIQYFHDTPGTCVGFPPVQKIFGFKAPRMKANLSLVPSAWMARRIEVAYGIKSTVVYPPVRSDFPVQDWKARENGFLCVARLSPEKRIETAIEIIDKVRRAGTDTHLRIVTLGGKAHYERSIARLCAEHKDWIRIERNLTSDQYAKLLGCYRYFINASEHEGFGIAIFEALNAGCIPFVMGTGGQQEMLDICPEFGFSDPTDAARTISRVMADESLQADSLRKLVALRGRFSIDRFRSEILALVDDFFEQRSRRQLA
ncbi:MAG: glycosyltransferase family 4 protein [Planctomycetaceae bacterium]|nr:glycosyltransferase family 4 protein [Planctomycetaceae bacterium]